MADENSKELNDCKSNDIKDVGLPLVETEQEGND